MARFEEKIAIVSGAASGMGLVEAQLLVAGGARVVMTDVNEADGKRAASELGVNAIFLQHDVADEIGWEKVVATTREHFGPPTLLINNGGVGAYGSIIEVETSYMRRVMEINFMGSFFGIRAVVPSMREMGGGSIVNVSSALAFTSLPGYFPVGTSKWAVRGMTRQGAKDLAPFNIRVNTLVPGAIDTPSLVQSVRDNQATMMPMGRVGTAEECAKVAVFLLSDDASYMSGAEVVVDGALIA